MDSTKDHYKLLLQAILPEEIFNYFEITQVIIDTKRLDVHLDELHQSPEEYSSEKLISKGFQSAVIIQDFPIRERMVYLHVRKRKWLVCSTGQVISRNWDLVAKGARYTKGFASFLKELFGELPDQ
ncbi:transposase [Ancylomarina salipaludis]|uniref:Transposase n=1 Tax=Ancylomarina salipaludis TaxID=2501299 RepID=A0A4Q1JLP0_9BACT|nr:transposase [Ancylomarina salipaludis]RXQ94502.1 transposase [Ancylomarina salipaludis]